MLSSILIAKASAVKSHSFLQIFPVEVCSCLRVCRIPLLYLALTIGTDISTNITQTVMHFFVDCHEAELDGTCPQLSCIMVSS